MKTQVIIALFSICISVQSVAQDKYILKANDAYAKENYCTATALCQTAYAKLDRKGPEALKKKAEMAYKVAECYRHTERYRDAQTWYNRAILLKYHENEPLVYLHNANMLLKMREFEQSKQNYTKYKLLIPGDARANAGIQSCEESDQSNSQHRSYLIENQISINRPEFDMSPAFDRKGKKCYFGSSRPGSTGKELNPRSCEPYMDLWITELDAKGNWTEPYLVKGEGINTEHDEGTLDFDNSGKMMFFTRCPNVQKQNLGCDIWVSEAKGRDEWKEPKKLEIKSHDSISVGHPCTEDGQYVIFASDLPGGFGGHDLWFTEYDRKTQKWSTPQNMGPEINTPGNELFPTFAMNGDLLFSSDGRQGFGGLDIYRAHRVNDENMWEDPQNIGSPVNSENNDYSLIERDGRSGYFTSERKGPNGENVPDIYSYKQPPPICNLKVIAVNFGEGNTRLEGALITVNGPDGTWSGITEKDGSIFWDKKPTGERYIVEGNNYTIDIQKDGYHENKKRGQISTVDLEQDRSFVVEMGLFPKQVIRLPEVRYVVDKWVFINDESCRSYDSLDVVHTTLINHPEMVLELSSHTDSRGGNERNKILSENRARACYKYLVEERGIDPRRIIPIGKGEEVPRTVYVVEGAYLTSHQEGAKSLLLEESTINPFKPINQELFELLHGMNRRTEGKVLSLDFDPTTASPANPEYLRFLPY